MASYTPNLNLYKPDDSDNYEDFREGFNENMDKLDQGGGGNQNIAEEYDDTATYAVGDYVIYNGLLYKCDTAVTTAETFDPTKWTHVVVTDEMGSGGSSGGHTIYDKDGTALAQENGLQFTGAVSVSDDSVNGRTVVDVEGGGNYYLNTLYSTEEKKIGYWTDGKPLYQKTLVINNLNLDPSGTAVDITSLGVDMCCPVYEGSYYIVSGVKRGFARLEYQQPNEVYLYPAVNRTGTTCFITLQYTKTTDTADPNPQFGNVIYLPTIYSEEEREVGVWTDGKPLYQKTFNRLSTALTNNAWNYDILGITGINIKNLDGFFSLDGSNIFANYYYFRSGSEYITVTLDGTSDIQIFVGGFSGLTVYAGIITVWYTKDADTAGSGTWTPSGELAHHYSTNEQVVGTWIDGKPLYQKTIVYTPSGTISSNTTIANVPNAKVMRVTEATAYNSSENRGYTLPDICFNGGTKFTYDNGDVTLEIINDSWSSSWTFYVTVQYTKTTDV